MYFLLDANVTAGYYLPKSLDSKSARKKIEQIIDYVRENNKNNFLYIPNFCIAETINVFNKYCFCYWDKKVRTRKLIDGRVYNSLITSFTSDIHNGKFIYHYELNRYHVLGINLISSINNHYKIKKVKNSTPMSTFDQLIITMGIHLAHIHGRDNVCILTADNRLSDVLNLCKNKQELTKSMIKKLKLDKAKEITGKPFSSELFPHHLNLSNCNKVELKNIFGIWPLNIKKKNKTYRFTRI